MRPQASFLVWLDCRKLNLSHRELINLFVNKAHLALNDGEMFGTGGTGFMRMNIAAPRSVISEALERLRHALQ
jgi:cystathionine beta-lyase